MISVWIPIARAQERRKVWSSKKLRKLCQFIKVRGSACSTDVGRQCAGNRVNWDGDSGSVDSNPSTASVLLCDL